MRQLLKISLAYICIVCVGISCKKSWLDEKPEQSLAIPNSIRDYMALMSATTTGPAYNEHYAAITELSAGDFYIITDSTIPYYNDLTKTVIYASYLRWVNLGNATSNANNERNFYLWKNDVWIDNDNYAIWTFPYEKILFTNVVLEGIEKVIPKNPTEQSDWNHVKGAALFHRAAWHYEIAKQFCVDYNKITASTDLGIPLRLTADFNERSVRSSVEETYAQITSDLKLAAELLPIETPFSDVYKCQPTKTAAYALLARIYLSMSNYDDALVYADKAIDIYPTLVDYNTLNVNANPAFQRFNSEVIFHMKGSQYTVASIGYLNVDSNLYKSYDNNDLRKTAFFRIPTAGSTTRRILYKGGYEGDGAIWTGLATDEMYLIRAECFARKGNIDMAMLDLNYLMVNRWRNDNGTWQPISANSADDALNKVLSERRKELVFRGVRWTDLKRLNRDPRFEVTLTRIVDGQAITLTPNSPLYVFLIPPSVIQLTGMQQNPR